MKKIFMIAIAMFGFVAMADATSNVTASEWGITVKCPAKWLGISFDTEVTFEGEA